MAFTINYGDGYEFEVDYFSKVIMFQRIMDMEVNKNTKSLMLLILRKTLCFDKVDDRLSMYHLQQKLEISPATLRKAIQIGEDENLIRVKRSKGGDMQSNTKYNQFRLSDKLLIELIEYIEDVRDINDFK